MEYFSIANDNRPKPANSLADLGKSLSEISDISPDINPDINLPVGQISELPLLIPAVCNPQADYDAIFQEFVVGSAIRERSFYRIWRLRNTGGWMQVVGINGETYRTWEEFVREIASNEALSIGRQVIFDRMRVYDQLEWMGYSHQDIISKMSARPSLYTRALKRVIDWDTSARVPNRILLPVNNQDNIEQVKSALTDLVKDIESFPRQVDAIQYIEENILLTPRVDIYMENDSIVVSYTEYSIDKNGSCNVANTGYVKFHPDNSVPDWLLNVIQTMIST